MQIRPVVKNNISEQVYEQMLEMILSGSLKVDTKIPSENNLREMFQVSRHTIRTVMNRFYALGIIETVPGDGTYLRKQGNAIYTSGFIPVIAFEDNDIFEIMEYRLGIEVESARLCATRCTSSGLQEIEFELSKLDTIKDDKPKFSENDINFHIAIAKASKNSMIYESLKLIRNVQNAKMSEYIMKTEVIESENEHKKVFAALANGDPDAAADAMYAHLSAAIERFKAVK